VTRVCIHGDPDVNLRGELLGHETAREALASYDLDAPYANSVAFDTVSLGAAIAQCNDLSWYLVRYAEETWIMEPSVSEDEWLSLELATNVRNEELPPEETDRFCKIYGVEGRELADPLYGQRSDDDPSLPEYDLAEVEETVIVRISEDEFRV
jgi:hypothetical protein